MKPPQFSSGTGEKEENIDRFFSHDPCEVLGVPSDATLDEITKAWKGALKKYHPDVNKNPRATEICQNISEAYRLLKIGGARTKSHQRPHSSYHSANTSHSRRETRRDSAENFENSFLYNLGDAHSFAKWVADATGSGISSERIQQLLQSERAIEKLKNNFIHKVSFWGENDSDHCLKYVQEWRDVGVELRDYFKLPDVMRFLTYRAIEVKIKIWGEENPDKFLEFVKSWKKAGVDLSKVVESPDVMRFLTYRAVEIKIKIWGEENPDKFLEFVAQWRKAGVELKDLVNSPRAQEFLKGRAMLKLEIWGKNKFKSFVDAWMKAGWHPSDEIWSIFIK
jgi:hypothetical protein